MTNEAMAGESSDLTISRVLRAPRAKVWQAWSRPELLKEWWCPKPWTTQVLAFDLRPGGAFHTLMRGPDGGVSDNPGCFLEVVAQTRVVFTTALTGGWRPATPWLAVTAVFEMSDEDDGTRYVAKAMHPDKATRDRHEQMGFFDGWNACADQLDAFALQLR